MHPANSGHEPLGPHHSGPSAFSYPQVNPHPSSPPYKGPPRDIGFIPQLQLPLYQSHSGAYPLQPNAVPYPSHPGINRTSPIPPTNAPYPTQPGVYSTSPQPPRVSPYPTQPGVYPTQAGVYPTSPHYPQNRGGGIPNNIAGAITAGGLAGLLSAKPGGKGKKAYKKALKRAALFGLPLAGAGVGAYAIKKSFHHKGSRSSSSSSSSSSSDSD